MEVFTTTRETHACPCGGRHSEIPEVRTRHQNTVKHTTWKFRSLSEELLSLEDLHSKVMRLMILRDLVRSGKVKD